MKPLEKIRFWLIIVWFAALIIFVGAFSPGRNWIYDPNPTLFLVGCCNNNRAVCWGLLLIEVEYGKEIKRAITLDRLQIWRCNQEIHRQIFLCPCALHLFLPNHNHFHPPTPSEPPPAPSSRSPDAGPHSSLHQ